jgi:acyl carrier protein/protein-L-isoaspartate O-methyltransferase/NADP-dependent 3-hydroxy acid dehydrogenase YdfG
MRLATALPLWETVFTPALPEFLGDHCMNGEPVVPGPVYVELARAAAAQLQPGGEFAVESLELHAPALVTGEGRRLQTSLERTKTGELRFRVLSTVVGDDGDDWIEHASGTLRPHDASADGALRDGSIAAAQPDAAAQQPEWQPLEVERHLQRCRALGFELGPRVVLYEQLEVAPGAARARLRLPAEKDAAIARALVLDAGVQVLGVAAAGADAASPRMFAGAARISIRGDLSEAAACHAIVAQGGAEPVTGRVVIVDAADRVLAELDGVELRRIRRSAGDAAHWHHQLQWPVLPLGAPEPRGFGAPDLLRSAAAVESQWPTLAAESELSSYVDGLPALRAVVAAHVLRALQQLGLERLAGGTFEAAAAAGELDVVEAHRRLLDRLLDILVEAGFAQRTGDRYSLDARALQPVPQVAQTDRCGAAVAALVHRCGDALADVLRGEADPLALLFPAGTEQATRAVYRDSAFGRAFNRVVATAVAGLAGSRGPGDTLRVLEVGAGSGATTEAVLAALDGRAVDYTFTDVSVTLVERARELLAQQSGLTFRTLDLERDAGAQGFAPSTYDVVIAANVVHATRSIAESVQRLHELVAPGGALVLLEGTHAESWVDITFGLTGGWWRFQDTELRPDYPLLPLPQWSAALAAAGFVETCALPAAQLARDARQAVLVARKPVRPLRVTLAGATALHPSLAVSPAAELQRDGRMDGSDIVLFDARGMAEADAPIDVRVPTKADALLATMQAVIAADGAPRLWIVTDRAQTVQPGDAADPDAAVGWGLGRTFALEHPTRWGGLIDVPVEWSAQRVVGAVLDEIARGDQEDQIAYRAETRHVARLAAVESPEAMEFAVQPGAYVISGGMGALGLRVAQWLVERGATELVLIGRTANTDAWPADDPRRAGLAALQASGVRVRIRAVDITSAPAVDALHDELCASGEALRGIVHAAAVFESEPIATLSSAGLERVLAPKRDGAYNLLRLAEGETLQFFVCFSSTTGLLGVAGLGAYAAANQSLDAFAAAARVSGIPATAIAWGLWDAMRLASAEDAERYVRTGLQPMDGELALQALEGVIASGAAHAIIADVDWVRLREVYEARRARPLLQQLGLREPVAPAAAASTAVPLHELSADRRIEAIETGVLADVRQVLRVPADRALDAGRGFFELGMDSLMSVELKGRLERRFGLRLPATLAFNYPSPAAVAALLDERLSAHAGTGSAGQEAGAVSANGEHAKSAGSSATSNGASNGAATATDAAGSSASSRATSGATSIASSATVPVAAPGSGSGEAGSAASGAQDDQAADPTEDELEAMLSERLDRLQRRGTAS